MMNSTTPVPERTDIKASLKDAILKLTDKQAELVLAILKEELKKPD